MEFTQQETALIETLAKATSQDVNVLKFAENKLLEWETIPGYYLTLLKIISNHSIDPTVRWLAASVLKDGIAKYWRKAAANAIQEEEKALIRSELMNTFGEPVNIVATQVAVLISRIARYDCPREWPELIPNLIQAIKSENALIQYRGLFTLNHVIKALASKRLAGDRRLFELITADIYSFMLEYWKDLIKEFYSPVPTPGCQEALEKVLLGIKILNKLTVHGFKKPHSSEDVLKFVNSLFIYMNDMFALGKFQSNVYQLKETYEKVIIHMNKVLLGLLECHPYSFVLFLKPSLALVKNLIFGYPTPYRLFEKFVIQCMNLMKGIILCPEYKMMKCNRCEPTNSSQNLVVVEANSLKNKFFQQDVLEEICTQLITRYFVLTKEDLQLWEDDPESFAFDDIGDSWKFCLHPCAHSLYLALLHEYRDVLTPLVLELVRNNQQIVDPQDMNGILTKDAVYCSVGLSAFDLYDEVNFDRWFTTTLIHELGIKEPNYRIIRRRVAWLIGKWTDVKPAVELRSAICGAVIPLLSKEEDMVVRLTAAVALKSVVDCLEFTPHQFMTFLEPSFSMLFTLLQEAKECSTKMQILAVLSFIVERVGEDIRPYSQCLIQYLPLLWEESSDHNMLRCAIVSTLIQFVRGLVSENLTSFLYPVIECCTDIQNKAHIYLIEEGLELWCTTVEYSSSLTPELFRLYRNLPTILEYTLEHLERCCSIIQAYILLNPDKFLTECGESLMNLCWNILTDVNEKGIEKIMQVVETVVKANPELAVKISFPLLVYITMNLIEKENRWTAMTMYLTIIGRVLLFSRDVFSQVLEKTASTISLTAEALLEKVLLVWNKMMPLVTQLEKRKLLALALSSLLTVQSTVVLAQFAPIVKNIVETLNDIMDIDCLSLELNSLKLTTEEDAVDDDDEDDTRIEKRKKQLNENDPAYKIELKGYLQSQLNDLKNQVGAYNFEALLQTLDAEILQQCRMYVAI